MSEYDLKKSEKGIGQLYPILEAKDGEIIDGLHREEADKGWKRVRLEHIDTEEKKLVARLVANFHRRIVPYVEKKQWINGLAEIYVSMGVTKSNVVNEIHKKTGLGKTSIRTYLNDEFKYAPRMEVNQPPRVPASQVIKKVFTDRDYGEQIVERHREEVLAEEKPKIKQQLKKELLRSPEFQREVLTEIRKPRIITPTEPCPSGVCELPPVIESGEAIDVRAEAVEQFWKDNPNCKCKTCSHYEKCGVIR